MKYGLEWLFTALIRALFGKNILLTGAMRRYLDYDLHHERPEQERIREATRQLGSDAVMQTEATETAFLAWMARLIGAKKVLEIGTFTGYCTFALAEAVGPNGRVVTLDSNAEYVVIGIPFWKQGGVADRIDYRRGDARTSLDALVREGATFDFIFINADKLAYLTYLERCLSLAQRGTLIAIDNTLWRGRVANPVANDETTAAMRQFNRIVDAQAVQVGASRRAYDVVTLPCFDGVTLLRVL